jgi:hypothetical protein
MYSTEVGENRLYGELGDTARRESCRRQTRAAYGMSGDIGRMLLEL